MYNAEIIEKICRFLVINEARFKVLVVQKVHARNIIYGRVSIVRMARFVYVQTITTE